MADHYRPDPDTLLAAIQKVEGSKTRGRLKVLLGMAAGVGKTFAMLEAAQRRKSDGIDVVIGYVETHCRAETDALVKGLEVIPRSKVDYRGAVLEEMDTDAVIARAPQLALVDELAHTNAPGSRHAKRYLDVIELLEAGIDVWTTVNVQHFESRADTVQQITGIRVQETLPDSILDLANEIEYIDLSPDDLRKRLAEGKVYTAERIETAANNFFRVGNLTALREMALRLTAERVDHQLQDYMAIKQIAGPWKSGERLMVAVSSSPFSEKLIRWTRRMAYNLEASWLAVYVETGQTLVPEAKERLANHLALARSLGAEVVTITEDEVTNAVLRLARQRNVTQIVMGKPMHTPLQSLLRGGSLVDRLIRASGDIDIYVVTGDDTQPSAKPRLLPQPEIHSSLRSYIAAALIVTGVTLFDYTLTMLMPNIGYQAVGLTELLAVLLIAVYLGRGPALLAATMSALTWNFLFIEPRFTFDITQVEDVILFLLYFVIALFAGNLTARIRTQERLARYSADRTLALYTLARETATAVNIDDVLRTAVEQIERIFQVDVAVLLPHGTGLAQAAHSCSTVQPDEKEQSVAQWAFEHGKPAGRFTETLPLASAQFFPLLTPNRTVGVIGIWHRRGEHLSADEAALLGTFINQIALVIERELLDEAAQQSAMMRESERLYTTLLNSISHELRTPLASIKGAASGLTRWIPPESDGTTLVKDIHSASDRLNRLVENLLDMSRLESGRLQVKRDWCDIGEIIGVAVKNFDSCAADHGIDIRVQPDLPLIQVDFVLIEQVLVNLLENACSYSPRGMPIQVSAESDTRLVTITVADRGSGIPPDKLEAVFDKFYRVPGTPTGGTGLGLSISRGLVEAHGGTLSAENSEQGGARFIIQLPLNGSPPPVTEAAL
jgi:two-component system sensor histidine kinase KdpD